MSIKQRLLKIKSVYLDNNSISNKEQLGFAGGIFGNAMGQDSVDTYGDKFNRNHMGLDNTMLTVKGNVSTILGFFVPPIAGAMVDMPAKPGKRSHIFTILKYAPIPFSITSMLLFIVPTTNAFYNFIYTLFFSLAFSVVDTFYDIALNALALKMVSDPADRKKFFTFEAIAATMGSMFPGSVIPIVVGMSDDVNRQKWLYFFVALVFCIIGVSVMYAPYLTIRERAAWAENEYINSQRKTQTEKIKFDRRMLGALLHNRPFVILMLSTVLDNVRQMTYRLLPYIYDDCLGDHKLKAVFDTVSGALSYVGLLAVPYVGKKISARAMLSGGYLYTSLFYIIMSSFNIKADLNSLRKKKYLIGLCIGFAGVPNAAQGAARRIIVADSTDYMEWYSVKKYGDHLRSDGLISAGQNIVGKANSLIKTNLYNLILGLIGYKSKDPGSDVKLVQTTRTLRGIYTAATLCGVIGNILPAVIFLFDNYTGKNKERIYAELCEMRALREGKKEVFEAD